MEIVRIPVDSVSPNPLQPRTDFEDDSLENLAESFKKRGMLSPIIVRKSGKSYQIVAGERRWRAAKLAGIKRIPALIRAVREDEVIIESLIENLHRKDLTDMERENAIHELWISGNFRTGAELAAALGLREKNISDDLDAWEFRRRNKTADSVPTYIIARTIGLDEQERKDVILKYEANEFRAIDIYSAVKTLKKAPDFLKKELLSVRSPITANIAELIVEKLSDPSDQMAAVNETRQKRLVETEVEKLVEDLRKKNPNDSFGVVSEVDTGYVFKCPLCNRSYRVVHNEPTQTHSLREL